ncbi:hypothetical protein JTP67_37360, partial [Streptomyces sp. S12]|nr:hypothetical protein [Streptomyces sp. S12]
MGSLQARISQTRIRTIARHRSRASRRSADASGMHPPTALAQHKPKSRSPFARRIGRARRAGG